MIDRYLVGKLWVAGSLLGGALYCKGESFGFKSIMMTPVGCMGDDGTLFIRVTRNPDEGITYQITNSPNGPTCIQENDGRFTGLPAGTYTIAVTNQTTGQVITSVMAVSTALSLTITTTFITPVSRPGGADGAISVAVKGGRPPYSYFLNGILSMTGPNFNNLSAKTYTVEVASDDGFRDSVVVMVVQPSQAS